MAERATPSPKADAAATRESASFRDPSGFVFYRDGVPYRQVNARFAGEWDAFLKSGLYDRLAADGLLLSHEAAPPDLAPTPDAHAVIKPKAVEFISYPYEWSFGQLKDAALLTLRAQGLAVERGFTLRDASAFNVQFVEGAPILIDSLSFEPAEAGRPWDAYRQFCQHFVAPLALIAYRDPRLALLLREFLDGIPLDLAAGLLPIRTRLNLGLASHIHLHARAQARSGEAAPRVRPLAARAEGEAAAAGASAAPGAEAGPRAEAVRTDPGAGRGGQRIGRTGQLAILDSLRSTIEKLDWRPQGTTWSGYTRVTSYTERAAASKLAIVERFLAETSGRWVWDLGANTGEFSRLAARLGRSALALDGDAAAVEQAYRQAKRDGEKAILPLVVDLSSPSPALGWALHERRSILERANADVVVALALVHHLAIGNNVPLGSIGEFFAALAPELIVEFVPKEDPMVVGMLARRRDVFPDYTVDGFRAALGPSFTIATEARVEDSPRTLFLMRRR
jgi:ribosomal protein L11 methylase PrmA